MNVISGNIQKCPFSNTVPAGVKGQPKYLSEKPMFGSTKLGPASSAYLFALDERKGTGKGYDVLYFDGNNNGDLTDDKPVYKHTGRYGQESFGPVKVLIDYGQGPSLYYGSADCYPDRSELYFSSAGYFTGKAKFGNKQHAIAVIDYNNNGTFDNRTGDFWSRDRILVDINDDGNFSEEYNDLSERCIYAKYFKVGEEYYAAETSPDGAKVVITQPEISFGAVRFTPEMFQGAVMSDETGLFTVSADSGKVNLPQGQYRVVYNSIKKTDKSGPGWILEHREYSGKPLFEVKSGEVTEFKYGEPLTAKLTYTKEGSDIQFAIAFTDIAGMGYTIGRGQNSFEQPSPPKINIFDSSGNLIASKIFEYG